MTILNLEDMGLPTFEQIPYMAAVEAKGWQVGGLCEPSPRDVAFAYNVQRRRFALVVDITTNPIDFRIVEGSAPELAEWMEKNRPELLQETTDTPHNPYGEMRRYADDPDTEARWWELCDACDADLMGLSVNVGDA